MATAYTWLSMYKNSVGKEQGMSVNEINGVFGKQSSEMSLKPELIVESPSPVNYLQLSVQNISR